MTNDTSEERETNCLVSDPAYSGGPTIKWPPSYFTPASEPANKVATTADLNNALMEATIKELEKLETQFQRYDDILTALTNARRIVARHLRVNLTDPATTLKSSNKMRGIASLKLQKVLVEIKPSVRAAFGQRLPIHFIQHAQERIERRFESLSIFRIVRE